MEQLRATAKPLQCLSVHCQKSTCHLSASALCASEVHPLFPDLEAAFLTTSWLFHVGDIMRTAPITSSPLRPIDFMQWALTLYALPSVARALLSEPVLCQTDISPDKLKWGVQVSTHKQVKPKKCISNVCCSFLMRVDRT